MSSNSNTNEAIQRARALRRSETRSEKLLWSLLRARQLSNLKFRRQFPIPPFIVDFACISHKLIIEIDGGYHDFTESDDARRELLLRNDGWDLIRFSSDEVVLDIESVGIAITKHLEVEFYFAKRKSSVFETTFRG